MAGSYQKLDEDQEDYTVFPSPKLSDLPSDLQDVNLDDSASKIEVNISSPPRAHAQSADNDNKNDDEKKPSPAPTTLKPFKKRRRYSRSIRPYINLRLKNTGKLFDREQIYFGCIAPLRVDRIDVHCDDLSKLDLHYCCGLHMKVDGSFTVHTILSTEFITSLKKIILKKETLFEQYLEQNSAPSIELTVGANDNNDNDNDDQKQQQQPPSKRAVDPCTAFHPRDHWSFAKDMEHKNAVIFVHGHNYAPDEEHAAEFVMDECLAFYADIPYLVIPFIWPCEGSLLGYDTNIIAEEYCGAELATFIRRLWSLFERIDFVAHGKGCNILMRALKLLTKEKPDVIDMSHVMLIAADMDSTSFVEDYLEEIYRFVKRVTVYVNTWDWKLYGSKYWNWSSERVGAKLFEKDSKVDCIDVTQLLSAWVANTNHYYLTNKHFKLDLIQALSKIGGVDPMYRNYVLPVYDSRYAVADVSLLDNTNCVRHYELVDKPYMKVVPDKAQNQRRAQPLNDENEGDTKQPDEAEQEDAAVDEHDLDVIAHNLRALGYVDDGDEEQEQRQEEEAANGSNTNDNDVVLQTEVTIR